MLDGILTKWNGNFGEVTLADGNIFPILNNPNKLKLKVGDIIQFDLTDKGISFRYCVNVRKLPIED